MSGQGAAIEPGDGWARTAPPQAVASAAHEVIEALTAITNYVQAMQTLAARGNPADRDRMQGAVREARAQTARASSALERLSRLIR